MNVLLEPQPPSSADALEWPLSRRTVLDLARPGDEPRVSVLLSTPPGRNGGQGSGHERIRWRNLCRTLGPALCRDDILIEEADALLHRIDRAVATARWRRSGGGVALFAAPGWATSVQVPATLPQIAAVGRRCLLAPLLPALDMQRRVAVLALSGDEVSLYEVTPTRIAEIALEGLPLAPSAAMPRRSRHVHAFVAAGGGSSRAVFHGTGDEPDTAAKQAVLRHFRQVDEAIGRMLGPQRALLVLAGVADTQALYREVSSYPHLLAQGVTGAPRGMTDAELRARTWRIAEPVLRQPVTEAVGRLGTLAGTGLTLTDPAAIVEAAGHGRVDTLLVSTTPSIWCPQDGVVVRLDDAHDPIARLDAAAVGAFDSGGTVYAVEPECLPHGGPVAAILRY